MKDEVVIKDFTPLFEREKMLSQRVEVQGFIANFLSLLNTHNLIVDTGIEGYKKTGGYEKIDLKDSLGYDILDHGDLSRFMSTTLASMAREAFGKGSEILDIAQKLRDFNPEDEQSAQALGEAWIENKQLISDLLNLYSEYLYKVFLDNPYQPDLVGLKVDQKV